MQLLNDLRNYPSLPESRKEALIVFLTALSGVLSVIDGLIPKPIPIAKLGLANIVTLIVILEGRYAAALEIVILRTLAAALVAGTALSLTHLLSFSGGIASVAVTCLAHRFLSRYLGPVGLSVTGALAHTLGQTVILALVYGMDQGLLVLVSIFLLMGTVTGSVIGVLAGRFLREYEKKS